LNHPAVIFIVSGAFYESSAPLSMMRPKPGEPDRRRRLPGYSCVSFL